MKFNIKVILITIEILYLVFLIGAHFFHKYGITSYYTGLIGFVSHSVKLIILFLLFYLFPDRSEANKSENKLKKERKVLASLLVVAFLLILVLSFV